MLYQTLPLFFHQLNPCSPPPPPPHNFLPSSPKMDCVETKALKTSFWPPHEMMSFKPTSTPQQVFSEDFWCGNGTNDDLFVEGLLDFSNNEEDVVHVKYEQEEEEEEGSSSVSSLENNIPNSESCVKDEFGSVPGSELSVPADDLADLEWLSNFVEDSFSEFSLQHVVGKETQSPNQTGSKPGTGFLSSVPAKARSKRSRTGGRVWSLGSLPLTESSSSSSSPSSSSSSSCLIFNQPGLGHELFGYLGKPPVKKQKRKPMMEAQNQRRCSHCGVQKTPQWRTGPLGAKTLCNACGVRFKSGRLLPEYRPACSPTFSSQVHSNNHRKVLEMRRKKEVTHPESELTHPVHGYQFYRD